MVTDVFSAQHGKFILEAAGLTPCQVASMMPVLPELSVIAEGQRSGQIALRGESESFIKSLAASRMTSGQYGESGQTRTGNRPINSRVLYRLSYTPKTGGPDQS
jgi:hypothetical protein